MYICHICIRLVQRKYGIGCICMRRSDEHLHHMTGVFTMSCLISRKKDKIAAVFNKVGFYADEESLSLPSSRCTPMTGH